VFDRPEARNALDARMFAELEEAWLELDDDPDVRVIVNAANGADFQTGVDVVQMARDREALRAYSRQTRDFELRFTAWHVGVRKPVIAAVHGVCAGGGLHFVADADIVILDAGAELCDPHVSVGQVSAFETIALARKSPMEPILRMAFTGRHERMSAARAYQLGIASEVVSPPDDLRDAAQDLAVMIARNSPAAMAASKQALWRALETGLTEACREGALRVSGLWGHPDQVQGPVAFTERRDAAWQPLEQREP
jgi:enoyl-CoA hydratase/carnithine racemase